MKNGSLFLATTLCLIVTVLIAAFLYNKNYDFGFKKSVTISDLVNYLTLISAISGGVFAYKILLATVDQRDAAWIPFVYANNIQFQTSGVEINFENGGRGPAIDVYWEPKSSEIKLKKRNPYPEMIKPGNRTGLARDWLSEQYRLTDQLKNNFSFTLICKDLIGNRYVFSYVSKNGSLEFEGVQKNGRKLVS